MVVALSRKPSAKAQRTLHECSPNGRLAQLEADREKLSAAYSAAERRKYEIISLIKVATGNRQLEEAEVIKLLFPAVNSRTPLERALDRIEGKEPAPPPPNPVKELHEVSRQCGELQTAIVELDDQIERARVEASLELLPELKPIHDELAKGLVDAVLALQKASAAYAAQTKAWRTENISWAHLGPMGIDDWADEPTDHTGHIAHWLRTRAIKHGHLERKSFPGELVYRPPGTK